MRIGMRKPSVKRMIKARTTGRAKRAVKKAVIPGYGRRGMGFVKNPKRSVKELSTAARLSACGICSGNKIYPCILYVQCKYNYTGRGTL